MKVKVTQLCPTLCDSMDCIVLEILQAGMGSLSHLKGIFPTRGLNPGLLHFRQILYQQSPEGSPRILDQVAYPSLGMGSLSLLQQIFLTQELNQALLHCRQILYHLCYQGSLLLFPQIIVVIFFPLFSTLTDLT